MLKKRNEKQYYNKIKIKNIFFLQLLSINLYNILFPQQFYTFYPILPYKLLFKYLDTGDNSYLCNKLGNVIFFRIRHGIFDRDVSRDQKHAVYGKKWISYVLHT
jgi:hypothetical protein